MNSNPGIKETTEEDFFKLGDPRKASRLKVSSRSSTKPSSQEKSVQPKTLVLDPPD